MSRDDLRRPLPLAYHPLYRFYEGGALTRQFRGLPERPDDWWSEDWVGSCTCAGNPDPDGRVQGLSTVDLPAGRVTLKRATGGPRVISAARRSPGRPPVPAPMRRAAPLRVVRCLGPAAR